MDKIPFPVLAVVGVLVLGIAIYAFIKKRARNSLSDFDRLLGRTEPLKSPRPKTSDAKVVAALRQELRAKFMHDEQKVQDAIAYEKERNPSGSEEEHCRAAAYRWDRLMN
jgi:uncharacterized protein HemX